MLRLLAALWVLSFLFLCFFFFFFFQAEDGIRDLTVTGVQTCALPISRCVAWPTASIARGRGTGCSSTSTPRSRPCATTVLSIQGSTHDRPLHRRGARGGGAVLPASRARRLLSGHPRRGAGHDRISRTDGVGRVARLVLPVVGRSSRPPPLRLEPWRSGRGARRGRRRGAVGWASVAEHAVSARLYRTDAQPEADRPAHGARIRRVHATQRMAAAPASVDSRQRRVLRLERRSSLRRRGVVVRVRLGRGAALGRPAGMVRMPRPSSYWARLAGLQPALARLAWIRVPRPPLLPRGPGRDGGERRRAGGASVRRVVRRRGTPLEDRDRRRVGYDRACARHALPHRPRRYTGPRAMGTTHRGRLDRLVLAALVRGEPAALPERIRRSTAGDVLAAERWDAVRREWR